MSERVQKVTKIDQKVSKWPKLTKWPNPALSAGQFSENGQFWQVQKVVLKVVVLDILVLWLGGCIRKKPGEPFPVLWLAGWPSVHEPAAVVHGVVVPGGMGPGYGADMWDHPWYGSGCHPNTGFLLRPEAHFPLFWPSLGPVFDQKSVENGPLFGPLFDH